MESSRPLPLLVLKWGGWITQNADGTYSIEKDVYTGTPHNIPGFPGPPKNPAGWYHTHPPSPNYVTDEFSVNDKWISYDAYAPGYLGVPSGAVKKYMTTGVTTTIGKCK